MSLMEQDPTRASLIVHRDGLFGLMRGLDIATDKVDRLVERGAALPEIGNAILDAEVALRAVSRKLDAMAGLVADAVAPDSFRQLGKVCAEIVAGMNARIEREMALNPPPAVSAKVLQFTGPTRRRIEHSGPFGGDAA